MDPRGDNAGVIQEPRRRQLIDSPQAVSDEGEMRGAEADNLPTRGIFQRRLRHPQVAAKRLAALSMDLHVVQRMAADLMPGLRHPAHQPWRALGNPAEEKKRGPCGMSGQEIKSHVQVRVELRIHRCRIQKCGIDPHRLRVPLGKPFHIDGECANRSGHGSPA